MVLTCLRAVPAIEEDSSSQRTFGRERTYNTVCERRVERAPLLSGRSSRHGES